VAGGQNGSPVLSSAELYDPASGTWSATGNLTTTRAIHTATLLASGKVLVVGGVDGSTGYLASAELYDPKTGTWSATGSLSVARDNFTATLLHSGEVLVVGGINGSTGNLASAELYDPTTGTWRTTGSLATARDSHTATLLASGKVLIAGGNNSSTGNYLASAELYDPATGMWTTTGSLTTSRWFHTATLLPSGKVLVAAGDNGEYLASAELYDIGLGFSSGEPVLTTVSPVSPSTTLQLHWPIVATGTGFEGLSEASGGNGSQNSSTNYPLLQLRSLGNEQTVFIPLASWFNTGVTTAPLVGIPPGYALATIITNGIPSQSLIILVSPGSLVFLPAVVVPPPTPTPTNTPTSTPTNTPTPTPTDTPTSTPTPTPTPVIRNGGFDNGLNDWQFGSSGGFPLPTSSSSGFGDSTGALLGNPAYDGSCNGSIPIGGAWISQQIVVPSGHPTLTFAYDLWTQDLANGTYDSFDVYLDTDDDTHRLFRNPPAYQGQGCGQGSKDFGWQSPAPIDLSSYAGQTHVLYFAVFNRANGYNNTYAYVDSVQISP
jgi:hypothetical protein